MRHNDYRIIDRCERCRAAILAPLAWSTFRFTRPEYSTCFHVDNKPPERVKEKKLRRKSNEQKLCTP